MMKPHDDTLSTADLARAADREPRRELDEIDVRGREDEPIRGSAATAERSTPAQPGASRMAPAGPAAAAQTASTAAGDRVALFSDKDAGDMRKRWSDIQTAFVDEPRRAVEHADSLVADVMKRLAEGFANERAQLEKQWDRGDNVTTEDLRLALRRYRSFFDRLLAA